MDLRVLNLGAGVQSSTVALLMAQGVVPPADIAVFADTQWEPQAVYQQVAWLEERLPFPVRRVTAGNIRADALGQTPGQKRFAAMPVYIEFPDGRKGQGKRQCTRDYKIEPIQRAIRAELGVKSLRGKVVAQVFGRSLDESQRMRDPRLQWERYEYPLVDMRWTRADCRRWLRDNGYAEPPKLACLGCPYHSSTEWRWLKLNDPAGFADAVAFDQQIKQPGVYRDSLVKGAVPYLHQTLQPLDQVDFRTLEDHGQLTWLDECEGMCGL